MLTHDVERTRRRVTGNLRKLQRFQSNHPLFSVDTPYYGFSPANAVDSAREPTQ